MGYRRITATELARTLSSVLNEVRYRDVSLEVWRGKEVVARIEPPLSRRVSGFPLERLNALVRGLPRLESEDAQAFLDELRELDQQVGVAEDPWGS